MSDLSDRTALVTGAASGIGLAIATELARSGARVALVDLPGEHLDAAAREVGGLAIGADLTRRDDCRRAVEETVAAFGTVHVLVNVAGIQHVCPIAEFPEDTWDQIIALMLTAPFLLTKYCWPHMADQRFGRLINLDSVHGLVASAYKSAYVSAKHGLIGLTRTAALEGGELGITSVAVCPGYVATPLVTKQIPDQARAHGISEDEVVSQVLLKRAAIKEMLEPSEVGEWVAFICGPAGNHMTGTTLTIDGGWTAS